MVGMWQDGVDAGPHFLRVISIDLRLVTNSDVKHPFVGIYTFSSVAIQTVSDQEKILLIFFKFFLSISCMKFITFSFGESE